MTVANESIILHTAGPRSAGLYGQSLDQGLAGFTEDHRLDANNTGAHAFFRVGGELMFIAHILYHYFDHVNTQLPSSEWRMCEPLFCWSCWYLCMVVASNR